MLTVDRVRSAADWTAIRQICALTGKAGDPIAADRQDAFAELWIAPYEKLAPEDAWVVRGAGDREIAGYLVAARDTRSFRRRKLISCDLPLLVCLVTGESAATEDTRTFVRRFFRLQPDPERSFSAADWRQVVRAFPAHLHINLLPHARRQGGGTLLIDALIRKLAAHGISGVHCICGEGPAAFYECQGFRCVAESVFSGRVRLFMMGRRVARD